MTTLWARYIMIYLRRQRLSFVLAWVLSHSKWELNQNRTWTIASKTWLLASRCVLGTYCMTVGTYGMTLCGLNLLLHQQQDQSATAWISPVMGAQYSVAPSFPFPLQLLPAPLCHTELGEVLWGRNSLRLFLSISLNDLFPRKCQATFIWLEKSLWNLLYLIELKHHWF